MVNNFIGFGHYMVYFRDDTINSFNVIKGPLAQMVRAAHS